MRFFVALLVAILPFKIKRYFYRSFFGFEIHATARIGISILMPRHLTMYAGSRIGHLNFIKNLSEVSLGESSSIGNLNWITGFPVGNKSQYFADQPDRNPILFLGNYSAITNRHLIDCTDSVRIGHHATVAGFRSQILTHSISIAESRQRSAAIEIGDYTFIGTGAIMLPGSCLPSFSILGAGSVLNKKYADQYYLYAGNPARPIREVDRAAAYFNRALGFVV